MTSDVAREGEDCTVRIKGIFEIAIRVKNLEMSARFYAEILGFQHGLLDSERRRLFLWVNTRDGMVVLQEDKTSWIPQHFAFAVGVSDLMGLKHHLEEHGISVQGPVELPWMSARALYCSDPDGHDVEFCALGQ